MDELKGRSICPSYLRGRIKTQTTTPHSQCQESFVVDIPKKANVQKKEIQVFLIEILIQFLIKICMEDRVLRSNMANCFYFGG